MRLSTLDVRRLSDRRTLLCAPSLLPPGASLVAATWALHRRAPGIASLWRSPIVVWVGRTALLVATGIALVALVRDVTRIL